MSNSWNNNGTVRNSRNSREGAKKRRLEDAYENAKKVIQRLKEAIAEEVQVSCFAVNCKETLRILLGKYQEICKRQIEELGQ